MKNWAFNKSLQARGLNQKLLADLINCGRPHLCMTLSNLPGRGGQTRRKLFPFLTVEEITLLGWRQEFEAWRAKRLPERAHVPILPAHVRVPRGTNSQQNHQ